MSPIAIAGPDQVITLPTDSASLDGAASRDPDGTISEWRWTRISGPASFDIVNAASAKTVVKNLDIGVYRIELLIKDNGGLPARDTLQVTIRDPTQPNRPPVANAGPDQSITPPINTITIDGSATIDPDNNIATYLWTKVSGPSSFNIANANAIQTQVSNLVQGVYKLELKVTDSGGLVSRDTLSVYVYQSLAYLCPPYDRPIINGQLVSIGNLSVARGYMTSVTAGNKLFFAGGYSDFGPSSRIDIYDLITQTWSTAELSTPRYFVTAATAGNKVFFAGGSSISGQSSSRVDIYDLLSQTWSTAELSEARASIITAVVGNKILFAGGCSMDTFWSSVTNKVDVYELSSNTWSTASLSETRIGFTATTVGSKIYFAGGWINNTTSPFTTTSRIDIYDEVTGSWSTSALHTAKAFHTAIFKEGKIYWAGGSTWVDEPWVSVNEYTCQVEIRHMLPQTTSFANLYGNHEMYWVNLNGAFEINDKIVFIYKMMNELYAQAHFEIYDDATNTWSRGILSNPLTYYPTALVAANNNIYIAARNTSNSTQVWKLEY